VLRCATGPDGQCASVAAGGLSRDDVRRVVTRNRAQVRHCYERALQSRPDLEGRLGMSWMIHPEGRVMGVRVSGANDLHSADIEQCVTQAVSRWQFPAANSPTAVSYPFMFQTQG
nr:AgmX/PglI C-terminal domain-containing protein [Myxococcota bacterium]